MNGVSAGMYSFYKQIAEKAGLPVLGFCRRFRRPKYLTATSVLVTADELSDLREKIDRLADGAEEGIDLHTLVCISTDGETADRYAHAARSCDWIFRCGSR